MLASIVVTLLAYKRPLAVGKGLKKQHFTHMFVFFCFYSSPATILRHNDTVASLLKTGAGTVYTYGLNGSGCVCLIAFLNLFIFNSSHC